MKTFATVLSALVAFAAADTCRLSAYALASSQADLGGFSILSQQGFVFQINDQVVHGITPTNGNAYPPNYGCPGDRGLYGYAHFDDRNKGGLGMCIENIKNAYLLSAGFDCRGLGGKKFKGTTGSDFFGLGNDKHAKSHVGQAHEASKTPIAISQER
ncbi:hypothetical protein LTR42_011859 [Elasticomyces elasticus]|nr:hypothetical protein LTR42_011859 [Elasticomyces elasticus]